MAARQHNTADAASLPELERRHDQLWALLLLIVFLFAVGLVLNDAASPIAKSGDQPWWTQFNDPRYVELQQASLVVLLLILAYFREKALWLKQQNRELVQQVQQLYQQAQAHVEQLQSALQHLEQMQEQLIQSEKLASVGLLAGGVAHEINNPLMVLAGRVELLLMDLEPGLPVYQDLTTIYTEAQRIRDIVRNLLAFSRQSRASEVRELDVNAVLGTTLGLLERQLCVHNIQVEKRWTSELSPVRGNVGQLQQVFVNLIVNAFQAMPQGGTLTITTGVRNGNVMVAVRDTGCGIPEQNLARLFDPFFTTKPSGQGTGLGLSVSRGIIEMHQGTIEVESEVGRGSCFTVYLPVASKEETRRDEVSESSGGG